MDNSLTKDARGFVDGVITMLKSNSKSKSLAPRVQSLLGKVTSQAKRDRVAIVTSSIALTDEEKNVLKKALTKKFKREITPEVSVSAELIGGFRVQVGDWVLDTTLAGQLAQLREHLMEGTHEQ